MNFELISFISLAVDIGFCIRPHEPISKNPILVPFVFLAENYKPQCSQRTHKNASSSETIYHSSMASLA